MLRNAEMSLALRQLILRTRGNWATPSFTKHVCRDATFHFDVGIPKTPNSANERHPFDGCITTDQTAYITLPHT